MQISRFRVITKSHQKDKWRSIVDLSHPKGNSINDGITKPLCGLSYITSNDTINRTLQTGPNTLLAKINSKSAFRLLPVHPADQHLLAMKWKNSIFIDAGLLFGLKSAPKLFNILVDQLSWITMQRGVSFSLHYLDDILMMGPHESNVCQQNLVTFKNTCQQLRVPLAEKGGSPCHIFHLPRSCFRYIPGRWRNDCHLSNLITLESLDEPFSKASTRLRFRIVPALTVLPEGEPVSHSWKE